MHEGRDSVPTVALDYLGEVKARRAAARLDADASFRVTDARSEQSSEARVSRVLEHRLPVRRARVFECRSRRRFARCVMETDGKRAASAERHNGWPRRKKL